MDKILKSCTRTSHPSCDLKDKSWKIITIQLVNYKEYNRPPFLKIIGYIKLHIKNKFKHICNQTINLPFLSNHTLERYVFAGVDIHFMINDAIWLNRYKYDIVGLNRSIFVNLPSRSIIDSDSSGNWVWMYDKITQLHIINWAGYLLMCNGTKILHHLQCWKNISIMLCIRWIEHATICYSKSPPPPPNSFNNFPLVIARSTLN